MSRSVLLSDEKKSSRKASPTLRAWNRSQLLSVLEQKCLINRIAIGSNAKLSIGPVTWADYWASIRQTRGLDSPLTRLERSWSAYVESRFDANLRREYCLRYFELLDTVLRHVLANSQHSSDRELLRRVLAFETFGLSLSEHGQVAVAAATSSVRHPVYLLAKLKAPSG